MDKGNGLDQIQELLNKRVQKYVGNDLQELKTALLPENKRDTKASFALLARKMLAVRSNLLRELGFNGDVVIKTVRVTGNGDPAESMSFMQLDFDDWCEASDWHATKTYQYFKTTVIALFVFQQFPAGKRVDDEDITFQGIKVWKVSDYDLEHGFKEVWEECRSLILDGGLKIKTTYTKTGKPLNHNNLPGLTFNGIAHIRPGGSNGEDLVKLPNGQMIARMRFWLNADFIREVLEDK